MRGGGRGGCMAASWFVSLHGVFLKVKVTADEINNAIEGKFGVNQEARMEGWLRRMPVCYQLTSC